MTSPQSAIDEVLIQGTCAVWLGGKLQGTAWLLDKQGHLVTAGHVLGRTNPVDEVEVRFPEESSPRKAKRVCWDYNPDQGVDWAVLELIPPLPDRTPLPISLPKNVHGQFQLYGFGKTLVHLSPGMGTFVGPYHPQDKVANRLFSLATEQTGEGGYSGAAIFSHEWKGVVAIQIEATPGPTNAPQGTTILAVPLYRIAQACPQVHIFSDALNTSSKDGYASYIYLSYARGGSLEMWLERFFLDELKNWLSYELVVDQNNVPIFSDHEPQRDAWDTGLVKAIQQSMCLVPILTPTYWISRECLAELESFKTRQNIENVALILGVLFHENGKDPSGATLLTSVDFHKHARPYEGFRTSAKYEEFLDDMKAFAKKLASLIDNVPAYEDSWPVIHPSATSPWTNPSAMRIRRPGL